VIKLVDVYTEIAETRVATKFLYELLKERDEKVNISHRKMPTFDEHASFVDSQPYREWFIIFNEATEHKHPGYALLNKKPIGAIYLSKQNEIGVSILKAHQGNGYGPMTICLLMNRHPGETFLANINPHNSRSITMFEGLGFEMLQVTYVKRPNHGTENEDRTCFVVGPTRPV
jgi:RimJ/RimL family protein N-acetyltransferase